MEVDSSFFLVADLQVSRRDFLVHFYAKIAALKRLLPAFYPDGFARCDAKLSADVYEMRASGPDVEKK